MLFIFPVPLSKILKNTVVRLVVTLNLGWQSYCSSLTTPLLLAVLNLLFKRDTDSRLGQAIFLVTSKIAEAGSVGWVLAVWVLHFISGDFKVNQPCSSK